MRFGNFDRVPDEAYAEISRDGDEIRYVRTLYSHHRAKRLNEAMCQRCGHLIPPRQLADMELKNRALEKAKKEAVDAGALIDALNIQAHIKKLSVCMDCRRDLLDKAQSFGGDLVEIQQRLNSYLAPYRVNRKGEALYQMPRRAFTLFPPKPILKAAAQARRPSYVHWTTADGKAQCDARQTPTRGTKDKEKATCPRCTRK